MIDESRKGSANGGSIKHTLSRRDLFKVGFAGTVLSCLNRACEKRPAPEPPYQPQEVYELTDGKSLYDDFDGNGNFQTYNQQNLAEAGKLNSRLWQAMPGAEVVQDPAARELLTIVNEEGQRIEYYVNGILKETEIPEDSELLLDPARTEYGPTRFLIIYAEQADGECSACFDNVRAVYKNRVS